jgi:hypothetical protein
MYRSILKLTVEVHEKVRQFFAARPSPKIALKPCSEVFGRETHIVKCRVEKFVNFFGDRET